MGEIPEHKHKVSVQLGRKEAGNLGVPEPPWEKPKVAAFGGGEQSESRTVRLAWRFSRRK